MEAVSNSGLMAQCMQPKPPHLEFVPSVLPLEWEKNLFGPNDKKESFIFKKLKLFLPTFELEVGFGKLEICNQRIDLKNFNM